MNFETIARPYAQAIYDHSEGWEKDLGQLELALEGERLYSIFFMPSATTLDQMKWDNLSNQPNEMGQHPLECKA